MTLLSEIEGAAIDSKVPLPDLLRKCKVLAARLKHQEFAGWIDRELNGYGEDDELPAYRQTKRGPSFGHFSGPFGSGIKNGPIPLLVLPDDLRKFVTEQNFRESVSSLDELLSGDDQVVWKWPADLIARIAHRYPMYQNMVLVDASSPVSSNVIKGILDTVRTRVLDFVLAVQAENPDAGDVAPNAPAPIPMQTVTQHFHNAIFGQANIGNLGPSAIGDGNVATGHITQGVQDATIVKLLAKLRAHAEDMPAEDKEEANDALKKVEVQLAKPKPDLKRIKEYLSLYSTIVTVASPTVKELIEYLVPFIEHLLRHGG